MGISISSWRLARAVAQRGHLGVVSGTAIEQVIAARLQEGDVDGHLRRAFDAFPDRALADRVFERWHRSEGLSEPGAYQPLPMFRLQPPTDLLELTVIAAFAEVYLAKEGVTGPIGINLLEKIQTPTLPTLYGALLANVDYVLMGAGIPRHIPAHLAKLINHQATSLQLTVEGGDAANMPFNPRDVLTVDLPALKRPYFLAIVSTPILAKSLARVEGVDGFIIEGPQAGGHNAPPRGWTAAAGNDEPVYGPRDEVDLSHIQRLGLPFWLAGQQDHGTAISNAQQAGAIGVQIGTAFAFCSDSGMEHDLRRAALTAARDGTTATSTEGRGSPTGFPFKTLPLAGSEGGRPADDRCRQVCSSGYLRSAYRKDDGSIGWRCAAEPEHLYVAKGGAIEDCADRRCLCRTLMASAGHPQQMSDGSLEKPLITAGDMSGALRVLGDADDYDANAVIDSLGIADGARHSVN
jgi:NAD(P)H-dependent flavin oxidoreductase YrpB (nitropropane dioxygenase family)